VNRDPIQLVEAGPDAAGELRALAESIWWEVYPEILSADQIRFMLDWMYAPATLRSDLADGRVRYDFLRVDGQAAGFTSRHPGEAPGEQHLAKLYLAKRFHGRGLGSAALREIIRRAGLEGASFVTLRVNRRNLPALRCYLRNGFRIERDLVSDIGGGFVMDDHWMRLDLPGASRSPRLAP
jgi:ribosomal protein S18 acetylase RimI-like enzyme